MRKAVIIFLMVFIPFLLTAQDQIAKGDEYHAKFDHSNALKAYKKALKANPQNYEAAWKISRAYVDVGENLEGEARINHFKKAENHARKAVKINSEGSKGHLYMSIALGRVALDVGAKERIRLSKEIKKEVDLAIKYDPNDDTAHHVLGRWHRKLANLSWVEKGFADLFLGGVPEEASNENAVKCFKKAIEIKPEHINHHLELGITYELMGNDKKAAEQYKKCIELPVSDSDDDKYKKQARERLEDL